MGDASHYEFRTAWRLPAAKPDRVFSVLQDVETYPQWWPMIRAARRISDSVGELRVRSRLPYDLVFAMSSSVEDSASGVLRADLSGDLEGWSQWTVASEGSGTVATFDQQVVVRRTLVRRAGLFARPLLKYNHAAMMRGGERGLKQFLAT